MLPSVLAKQLQKGIGDYIETTFPMTNEPFKDSLSRILASKEALYHNPYIAVRLPFRVAEEMPECFEAIHPTFLPYVHQQKAFDRLTGDDGQSTLIATGTGSGKTECFLYPILEYCYQHRGERGIKALIIYPMNALATDQAKRIAKLIHQSSELRGNVTAGMYVGGYDEKPSTMMSESSIITDRETMLNNPPDILLTNYKMLDYLLVRPKDAGLWRDNKDSETLKYVAVDELHTFDGAQGTDLACLLRRIKSRLGIQPGYLCCIGTSATMGDNTSCDNIRNYASEIFGEPFEKNSIITEDRLSSAEFFVNSEITDFALPSSEQISALEHHIAHNHLNDYLRTASAAWITDFELDPLSDEGRIALSKRLMTHSFMQSVINLMEGQYYQIEGILEELKSHYPTLSKLSDGKVAIEAFFALISHARIGTPGKLRPFLNVHVQLWVRELRRFLAKVSAVNVTYSIAYDLNAQQLKQYLPVVNCRDCGSTGWVSLLNERHNATIQNFETFYNRFFSCDSKIAMMFPYQDEKSLPESIIQAGLCPNCLQVNLGTNAEGKCERCGNETIKVFIPQDSTYWSVKKKQYVCPCCGSKSGLSLIGIRSTTEISAIISQLFASKFNDDKKTLTFSDNVQDAAHSAGFLNARTWRFGLRTAIQLYVQNGGVGQSLEDFIKGFIAYWHEQMLDEDFVGHFIAPNMTWFSAYEIMLKERKLQNNQSSQRLIKDIEKRLRYEIMQEYGLLSKVGRTLEKSACSCIAYKNEDIISIAEKVKLRVDNELALITDMPVDYFYRMVIGFVDKMRSSGAFSDKIYSMFVKEKGNDFFLSNSKVHWLPGVHSGKNAPRFMIVSLSSDRESKFKAFDMSFSQNYLHWTEKCISQWKAKSFNLTSKDLPGNINKIILEELIKAELLIPMESSEDYKAYGLNKNKIYISDKVVTYKCDKCGTTSYHAEENALVWNQAPCSYKMCENSVRETEDNSLNYYGKLFSNSDMVRINVKEHTGLLQRADREILETDFKRLKGEHRLWDPNVLSCTPTLEMGIDIGDLSTVVLSNMPPAQAQYIQRAGRAGRKDGNALTLAVANARPHDLYFYADPLDMIAGQVNAPKIFLKASAVLERQFVAYCLDSWVRKGIPDEAIPQKVGSCLSKLEAKSNEDFPFNFLKYVKNNLTSRFNSFVQMFVEYLDDSAKEELQKFAKGDGIKESPMYVKILEAFTSLKKQQESLRESIKQLKKLIKDLESKPNDSSFNEEIKELKHEESALLNVLKELGNKDVFNFLSDEGLLPNYAFPEAGIVLKAILWRKDENEELSEHKRGKYEKTVYEYSRGASSAISEFAPNNSFYVDGRKLKIDQIDMTTAITAPWRLCPSCSHAQIEEAGKNTACCPQCGSPAWADAGQVRNMLKVQLVYSNMDYKASTIGDDSEDRMTVFYTKQLLVDVDEEHDILSAYRMDNDEFAFGYEFVKKAKLREINFGENDTVGEKLTIAGVDDIRKGFKICKYCGKVQSEKNKDIHTKFCKTVNNFHLKDEATSSYLFLFREFQTEILRLLIPATTMDASSVKKESFIAAFMLGMKQYFGNVDHLRATISEVPVPEAEYRKQYLVIYDSVPGGTGYLKQLMHEKNALITVFEKALAVMENCSCKDDPQKDGCYHCLYAYRQSQQMGNISRSTAIRLLKSILSGKHNIECIAKLGNVPVNSLFDSELERRFIEAISSMGNDTRTINITNALVNNKFGYVLKINDSTWEIEPQCLLDNGDGVAVSCKPDFVFWPISDKNKKPVAVFTDGFKYHKDIVADDTLKREAIRRSGKYRVWVLSWKDVQTVFQSQENEAEIILDSGKMPSGKKIYNSYLKHLSSDIEPNKMSPMELLLRYLYFNESETIFSKHAEAYAWSLLSKKNCSLQDFEKWNDKISFIESNAVFEGHEFLYDHTKIFTKWKPSFDSYVTIWAGVDAKYSLNAVFVYAELNDQSSQEEKYERSWNGFWQFFNVMQFNAKFIAVSSKGLESFAYLALNIANSATQTSENNEDNAWADIMALLYEEEVRTIACEMQKAGIVAPDEIGYDLIDDAGEVLATLEMVWTDKKIAFLTESQLKDQEIVEKMGWKIIKKDSPIDSMNLGGK